MSAATTISLEEYLAHTYHPDCEYVDGQLVERNVGEFLPSLFQSSLGAYLLAKPESAGYRVLTECRIRVRGGSDEHRRYRIPDISIVAAPAPATSMILEPPLAVVEILSPDDRFQAVVRKCDDYEDFGIPGIWLVNSGTREIWTVHAGNATPVPDRVSSFACDSGPVPVDFNVVFASRNLN